MYQRTTRLFTLGLGSALIAASASAQERDWSRYIDALEEVSEEALSGDGGPMVVGGEDCNIQDAEVDSLDTRLPLTAAERADSLRLHGPWGFPEEAAGQFTLVHREYVVIHDAATRQPAYAQYRLTRSDVTRGDRVKCFRADYRLDGNARAELPDYVEPVFDRGHLVPRADMNRSRSVMLNTFLLSNMMPQHADFNRQTWKMLEGLVRAWAKDKLDVLVVSGPVYDHDGNGLADDPATVPRVSPRNRLAVPSHFYKIVLHERPNGFIEAIAIMLPHEETGLDAPDSDPAKATRLQRIENAIVSIDEIERATGIDFFSGLDASRETAVERSIAAGLW